MSSSGSSDSNETVGGIEASKIKYVYVTFCLKLTYYLLFSLLTKSNLFSF